MQIQPFDRASGIADLASQRHLQTIVDRPAGWEVHGVAAYVGIDSGESGACIGSQTKEHSGESSEVLSTGIQAVPGKIGDTRARYCRDITVHGRLGTCASANSGSATGTCYRGIKGIQCRVHVQKTRVADVVCIVSKQEVSGHVTDVVCAKYRAPVQFTLQSDVHLHRSWSHEIRGK